MQLAVWTYEGPPHVGAMRVATAMTGIVSSESRRRCISPKSKFRFLTEYSQEEFETAISKFMGKSLPKDPPKLFKDDK